MSANRERNFGRPSIESPFSGRERYYVYVKDKKGNSLRGGEKAEVTQSAIIVHSDAYGDRVYLLSDVDVRSDYRGDIKPATNK